MEYFYLFPAKITHENNIIQRRMRIAIEGCCHGDLDKIYATIEYIQQQNVDQPPIDLLICCGDFQSVRNEHDLNCMNVPR